MTVTLACFAVPAIPLAARDLTFEQRLDAQEAIERVYHSHQVGVSRPFEEVVPGGTLVVKVRAYLAQSAALETLWNSPITPQMLRAELERIARGTRFPDRLEQLYAVLGNDPVLVQETLARATLADRLARSYFAADRRVHAAARLQALQLREEIVRGGLSLAAKHPAGQVLEFIQKEEALTRDAGEPAEPWNSQGSGHGGPRVLNPDEFAALRASLPRDAGEIGPLVEREASYSFRALLEEGRGWLRVVLYTFPKTRWDDWWPGVREEMERLTVRATVSISTAGELPRPRASDGTTSAGAAFACQLQDVWDSASLGAAPDPRFHHTAVWTGNLMIVWGGTDGGFRFSTGGRYDPLTDTWTPTTTLNAPEARESHTAVWTGTRMIVWGGLGALNGYLRSGDRYDPVADAWTPTSIADAPEARERHTAVWAGSVMVVWGGVAGIFGPILDTGGLYDPLADSWAPGGVSTTGSPSARIEHTAVWTGSRMIVWGGRDGAGLLDTGGPYDPVANHWDPNGTSTTSAPRPRGLHVAVWTGAEMIVWGGRGASFSSTGGRYDPVLDSWSPTSDVDAPAGRWRHAAVWTGTHMIVWGGSGLNTGGQYDPAADAWLPTSTVNAPAGRSGHTAVWTDSLLLVWGGHQETSLVETTPGGRYDPSSDCWTPISSSGAPSPRLGHTAVWTGTLMIIWGGTVGGAAPIEFADGARYDPLLDVWTPVAAWRAPAPRYAHTAIWTGAHMVVWGGTPTFGPGPYSTGGRYDPVADAWDSDGTSMASAPSARSNHTAVWTGSEMVIWGGGAPGSLPTAGGRYNPLTDNWIPASDVNAPSGRISHTAIWTGSIMVIWGGNDDTGGRYDPVADAWDPNGTSLANAPTGRGNHTAVWTGSRMIVWGGGTSRPDYFQSGGSYDPVADAWDPNGTSIVGAPSARTFHTAVWSGSRMVVWGGGFSDTGGIYDPASDTWLPVTTAGAPSPRGGHTAVWTGSWMLVWGGSGPVNQPLGTGGRYVPGEGDDLDGDGVCDPSDNCAVAYNPGQVDGDADGSGLVCDCDDAIGSAWTAPGEVRDLVFCDAGELSWLPPTILGGLAPLYDTLRSSAADDFLAAACVESDDGSDTSAQDPLLPDLGKAFFYLVRAQTACASGEGLLGRSSGGTPIAGRSCP